MAGKKSRIIVKINWKFDEVALPVYGQGVCFERTELPVHYVRAPACDEFN